MLHQHRNVLAAFAQGRELEAHHVEAMEEVFAELALTNHRFQIAVGGGDDAHIHGNHLRPADPLEGLLLEHAQEFHLRVGRQVADFVEEERALVRLLEAADAPLVSAGERAAFVAEQFAFQQVFRDGGAIDRDKRGFGARAVLVDGAGDQFLARAGFAPDEHGDGLGGDAADFLAHVLHRAAGADEGRSALGWGVGQGHGFTHEAAGIHGAMQHADEGRHLERLLQVIVSAELGGLDGGLNRAVRGHQHDGQARLSVVKLPHEFQAAESRQAQVGQHHIAFVVAGAAQALVAAAADGDFEAVLLEHVAKVGRQTGVVFNEKDSRCDSHWRQCP